MAARGCSRALGCRGRPRPGDRGSRPARSAAGTRRPRRSRATSRTRSSGRQVRRPSTVRRRARVRPMSPTWISGSRGSRMRWRRPRARMSATSPGPVRRAASVSGCWPIADRFRSFALRPGIDLVMDATDFPARLAGADLVITGEGRIDAQTAYGKTALGVAQRAAAAGVPCIAVGGGVEPEGIVALAAVGAMTVPVVERPQTVEEAMAAGPAPVERCGERLARLVSIAAGQVDSERRPQRWSGEQHTAMEPPKRPSAPRRVKPRRARRVPASASSRIPGGPGRSASSAIGRGSSRSCIDGLAGLYGHPTWQRRLDPTSELILTILTQNSADTNAEVAFEALRARYPGSGAVEAHNPGAGWGGDGPARRRRARLGAPSSSRHSPSWSRRSGRAASATRRRHGSRRPCGRSARNAATTPSSSSATCRPSRRATG